MDKIANEPMISCLAKCRPGQILSPPHKESGPSHAVHGEKGSSRSLGLDVWFAFRLPRPGEIFSRGTATWVVGIDQEAVSPELIK